ncbi:hypothetical protein [Leifsonia sp. Leaf264]|uniref:hypothetical protein n=1 Tax=Leifsonia sp. Leaf264 TaxID=1736314 RepID=UPI0006FBE7E8|nr:hypothetical protein [Leifsonia sp. Leaf264]KQO98361.1 hypothetical protein ASF30_09890 [Leifsonia sp. Leaf264]
MSRPIRFLDEVTADDHGCFWMHSLKELSLGALIHGATTFEVTYAEIDETEYVEYFEASEGETVYRYQLTERRQEPPRDERFSTAASEAVAEAHRSVTLHGYRPDLPVGGDGELQWVIANDAKERTDRHTEEGTLTWEHILREEIEEAFAETDPQKIRAEMVQVAAVALKIIDAIDHQEAARS